MKSSIYMNMNLSAPQIKLNIIKVQNTINM